jgi:tetratricopeptide (TPR) repeat protein
MAPTFPYLYHRLAIVYRHQGRHADARREFQQAERYYEADAERSPSGPDSWRFLADVRTALGDHEGARKARDLAQDAEQFASLGGSISDVVSDEEDRV